MARSLTAADCSHIQQWLYDYLSIDVDPYDFNFAIPDWIEEEEITDDGTPYVEPTDVTPDDLSPAQLKAFTKWLKKSGELAKYTSEMPFEAPPYLVLHAKTQLPAGSWFVHFTSASFDRFDRGTTLEGLHLSTWKKRKDLVQCAKNLSDTQGLAEVVFGFAYDSSEMQTLRAMRAGASKYGKNAILFQCDCAVEAYHDGDDENQSLFPLCSEYNLRQISVDNDGVWLTGDSDEEDKRFDSLPKLIEYLESEGKPESVASEAAEPDLSYLLRPRGEVRAIGHEDGPDPPNSGIARYRSQEGSVRYVMYVDGAAVSALQVMTRDKRRARIANVWTDPAHRRHGYAAALLERARRQFEVVEHSDDLSPDAVAWKGHVGEAGNEPSLLLTNYQIDTARDMKAVGFIRMTPLQFLSLTSFMLEGRTVNSFDQIKATAAPLESYNDASASERIRVPPYLSVDRASGNVVEHEGRHRAAALHKAGGRSIYVAIRLFDGERLLSSRRVGLRDIPPVLHDETREGHTVTVSLDGAMDLAASTAGASEAGVIQLDHDAVERGTERVLAAYGRILRGVPLELPPEELGAWFLQRALNARKVGGGLVTVGDPFIHYARMTPFHDYDLKDVRGQRITVGVIPVLVWRRGSPALILDAATSSDRRDFANIWIRVNAASPEIEALRDSPTMFTPRFESIFLHELTHVRDVIPAKDVIDPGGGRGDQFAAYINSPHEVRAYGQQIVADAVYRARTNRQVRQQPTNDDMIQAALAGSRYWSNVDAYLTDENRAKILRMVYRGLEREGLLKDQETRLPKTAAEAGRRLTRAQKADIANDVEAAARENAADTEELTRQQLLDHGPEWAQVVIDSLKSIRDSIQSEREYSNYAVPRALTSDEAHAIVDPIIARYTDSGASEAGVPVGQRWYHLTDRARFKLDPRFSPADNALAIEDRSGVPGIYLGQSVETWVNGFGYWRPFVVEFSVDPTVTSDPGVHGRYGGEMFVPASSFDKLTIERVIPIDAYAREEFGEAGWIESRLGVEFDTGEPIKQKYRGYHYPGPDVRNMPADEVDRLKRQMRQTGLRTRAGELLGTATEARRPRLSSITWFHGGPRIDDWSDQRWDRDRTTASLNDEGPGIYWTTWLDQAFSYGPTVYQATMRDDFRLLPTKRPSMRDLEALYDLADDESKSVFLSNWNVEFEGASRADVRNALNAYRGQDSLFNAYATLYHDLFRYNADAYVEAMRSLGCDGYVLDKSRAGDSREIKHLVLWNPRAMYISEYEGGGSEDEAT